MKIRKNIAISESGFVFNPVTGESYTVNPIGTEIIQLLNEGMETEQITISLCDKYLVDRHTFEKDLSDFVGMLEHHHISQRHEPEED